MAMASVTSLLNGFFKGFDLFGPLSSVKAFHVVCPVDTTFLSFFREFFLGQIQRQSLFLQCQLKL